MKSIINNEIKIIYIDKLTPDIIYTKSNNVLYIRKGMDFDKEFLNKIIGYT